MSSQLISAPLRALRHEYTICHFYGQDHVESTIQKPVKCSTYCLLLYLQQY